ncbi:hypothetical protein DI53_0386 [Sphingobacterium deserti]|uniref:Uncharacterized protein n=1 Tax=Sphingobacterium deserti TaxID=1229276 RepID=A0A0B8T5I0_9SPHI|nr:hypothetical protein DI53_0386 [Sphingobacterium deserti]
MEWDFFLKAADTFFERYTGGNFEEIFPYIYFQCGDSEAR